MAKLNQVLAIEKRMKNAANVALTQLWKKCQNAHLFEGYAKTYRPHNEDGDKVPNEVKVVEANVEKDFEKALDVWADLVNTTLDRDAANCNALVDVEVDGKVIFSQVPAIFLLWLEKEVTTLINDVTLLPTLDASEVWTKSAQDNLYHSAPKESLKTKKIPKAFEKSPATKEHPAQVDTYYEDVPVGTYNYIRHSGAMSPEDVAKIKENAEKYLKAIKFAREAANATEAPAHNEGKKLVDLILGR